MRDRGEREREGGEREIRERESVGEREREREMASVRKRGTRKRNEFIKSANV